MIDHTPTPWIAAAKYSSVVGVPIVAQTGKRICNTAFPSHVDDDEAKHLAEANAAFIVKAVNNHVALVNLVQTLLDNDPDEPIADNGMTVLDGWRDHARRVLDFSRG